MQVCTCCTVYRTTRCVLDLPSERYQRLACKRLAIAGAGELATKCGHKGPLKVTTIQINHWLSRNQFTKDARSKVIKEIGHRVGALWGQRFLLRHPL